VVNQFSKKYDIVVIGGGHAGVEAAWTGAKLGLSTALVTLIPETIAQMSCNPAIGGVGKGQIVREIDALGGLMGLAADASGIQFRMLNRSKGAAVWGPRCQSDRHAYAEWVQKQLAGLENLTIIAGEAKEIISEKGRVTAVLVHAKDQPDLIELKTNSAIVTTGTFLNGIMHVGDKTFAGGRFDEPASVGLSSSLQKLGIELGRLKTGTCPRLATETIDYDKCRRQDGDEPPIAFSFMTPSLELEQTPCWLTATNPKVHEIILSNFHRAPMYTGQIQSTGPRYCPSIETKVERFSDKDSHQIFIEPEGLATNWVYCNGITTSMPPDVQDEMIHNIVGLENAKILRYGYAIEYDFAQPTQLQATLETKKVSHLFLAGQINGTTGYEEAAAQGLMAALNAAAGISESEPIVLRRDQAYIGVMIDDLVTKGVTEPYRMFTSRAEHRLSLRADNADRRLSAIGRNAGLVDDQRWKKFSQKQDTLNRLLELLKTNRSDSKSLWELLQRPEMSLEKISSKSRPELAKELSSLASGNPQAVETLEIDARYAGYLEKQLKVLKQVQELDSKTIPDWLEYHSISHLRHEAREKLTQIQPRSLGQALRISGITPADITVLAVHIAKGMSK